MNTAEEPTLTDQDGVLSLKEERSPIMVAVDSVSQSNDNISQSQKSIHLDPERIKIENSFDETEQTPVLRHSEFSGGLRTNSLS